MAKIVRHVRKIRHNVTGRDVALPAYQSVVIGAGPAGLACAAALQRRGISSVILEKADNVGSSWRNHYDRLHLHTSRTHSGLPGLPMPSDFPKYPARLDVVEYLESYARHFDLTPRFETEVLKVVKIGDIWSLQTGHETLQARNVIFATGLASCPHRPTWPGLDTYKGKLLHSSEYRRVSDCDGSTILVVGFGNSGGEIALDLAGHGKTTYLSVRGPVNVVPRDLFGIPILSFAISQQWMPYKIADFINAPVTRVAIGDLSELGLKKSSKGPRAQIIEDGRVPLLDIGTIRAIREGRIKVRPAISHIQESSVVFEDGSEIAVDTILLATGYKANLAGLLPDNLNLLNDAGAPLTSGSRTCEPGIFFCSYRAAATGQLREIGREAEKIAEIIEAEVDT